MKAGWVGPSRAVAAAMSRRRSVVSSARADLLGSVVELVDVLVAVVECPRALVAGSEIIGQIGRRAWLGSGSGAARVDRAGAGSFSGRPLSRLFMRRRSSPVLAAWQK